MGAVEVERMPENRCQTDTPADSGTPSDALDRADSFVEWFKGSADLTQADLEQFRRTLSLRARLVAWFRRCAFRRG